MSNEKTWVLIRGLVRGKNHWLDFETQLRRHVPDARVIYLEIPGNGSRFREVSPLRVEKIVEDFREQLRAQGVLGQPLNLLTISLGSMVGLSWLAQYPQEISRLICMNTSSRLSPFFHRLRPTALLQLLLVLWLPLKQREEEILWLTVNSPEQVHRATPEFFMEARRHPVSLKNALRQLFAAAWMKVPEISAEQAVKILFLVCKNDRLVNCSSSLQLAKKFNARVKIHDAAGHDLPLEQAEWVLAESLSAPSVSS